MESGESKKRQIVIAAVIAVILTGIIALGTYAAVSLCDSKSKTTAVSSASKKTKKKENSTKVTEKTADEKKTSENSFPYYAQDGYIRNICICEKSPVVLEDGCLSLINSSGKLMFSAAHSYSSPMIKCSGERILLYDKASPNYRIFDTKGQYAEGNVDENTIVTGAICKNGIFALVSSSNGSSSFLTVFDKNGKNIIFKWKCCPEHITGVTLSPDGKRYAVSVMSAQNGSALSKIYFFDRKTQEEDEPYIVEKGTVIDISFITNNTISVVTTENRFLLRNNKEEQGYPTSSEFAGLLKIKNDENGNTAVLNQKIDTMYTQSALVFNRKNAERYDDISAENIKDIALNKARLYILSDNTVSFYNSSGVLTGTAEVNDTCNYICAYGEYAYCASDTCVYKILSQ